MKFLAFLLLIFVFPSVVNAADLYAVNNGATVAIDEHSVCKKVTNSTGAGIMVPTKSSTEWSYFRSNHQGGITLDECIEAETDLVDNPAKYVYRSRYPVVFTALGSTVENIHGFGCRETTCNQNVARSTGQMPSHNNYTMIWIGMAANGGSGITGRRNNSNQSASTFISHSLSGHGVGGKYQNYSGNLSSVTSVGAIHGPIGNTSGNNLVMAIPGQWIPSGSQQSGTTASTTVGPGQMLFAFSKYSPDVHTHFPNHYYFSSSNFSGLSLIYSGQSNWYGSVARSVWINNTTSNKTVSLGASSYHEVVALRVMRKTAD